MVFFVISKSGFEEIKKIIMNKEFPVWMSKGVLSDQELTKYRNAGVNLTEFNKEYSHSSIEKIEEAILTIQEHHPGERIFVERYIE